MSDEDTVESIDDDPESDLRLSAPPSADEWATALALLQDLLKSKKGLVSSRALRNALATKGLANARSLVVRLRYYDFDAPDEQLVRPSFRWYGHARSFYTADRYESLKKDQDVEASKAECEVSPVSSDPVSDETAQSHDKPRSRQEERRLGTYISAALEDIYQSDHTPEDAPYVFDVHSARPGSEYENVDLLAVHWRSSKCVELVSIEAKLEFTARLVQQASHYARFSDRVWLAVPVLAGTAEASMALREFDPQLFEHVVSMGLGILACRRRPGKSYEVVPVQWPKRMTPDPVEKELFLERYRDELERACVLAPRAARRYAYLG